MIEQTPNGPRDTHHERVCLAAGLTHHAWWLEVRVDVEPADFSHVEHQRIAEALDQLYAIGPFVPIVLPDYAAPAVYWPSSLNVRTAAVATLTDLNWGPLRAITLFADGLHERSARVVRVLAEQRARILDLRYELRDLTE